MAPAIIALAQFAPLIMKWMGASNSSTKIAASVAEVATSVAGVSSVEEAVQVFQMNTEKAYEFRAKMLELEQQYDAMYLQDVADARARDKEFVKMGMTNSRANFMFFLAIAVICAAVWMIWRDPNINEYLKGIMTLVIGRFLGYLDNIYSFEFGTTRASKEKDHTISNLSKE